MIVMTGLRERALAVARALDEGGLTLAVAESCTGGAVADALTDVPGISNSFLLGVVAYSDGAKTGVLSVSQQVLDKHGAISPQAAAAMAEGVREVAGSTLSVGVTGAAGPDAPEGIPVGLVYTAVAREGGETSVREHRCRGDRHSVKREAATLALEHILDMLNG